MILAARLRGFLRTALEEVPDAEQLHLDAGTEKLITVTVGSSHISGLAPLGCLA